ncbi:hypothetical protein [Microtetraspora malaysiensis]|uniref:hypothetical protein n=1 Tax=Microtetraspora malaysiensis TaxID=161358 RepID=UPI003D8E1DEF
MTPQEAAAKAAEILEQANAMHRPPGEMTGVVAVADGWRRLALALHELNYAPTSRSPGAGA